MKKNEINNEYSLNVVPIWDNSQNQNHQNQEELKYLWLQYQGLELEILELHQQIATSIGHLGLQKLLTIYKEKTEENNLHGMIKNGGIAS